MEDKITITWQMEAHGLTLSPSSLVPRPRPPYRSWLPNPSFSPSQGFNFKPTIHSRIPTKCQRWDSNAESVRSKNFNFNFRGNQDNGIDEDEYEDFSGTGRKKKRWWSDESESEEGFGGILDEAIDGMWIFKVFKLYGWSLPIILMSWLLSSGPKAFLMALALPLGQSALQLAFEKLWGQTGSRTKSKSRPRRKTSRRSASNAKMKNEEDEAQSTGNRRRVYQSWVAGNDSSVNSGTHGAPKFGGWDDLDRFGSSLKTSRMMEGTEKMPRGKGKLSRKERKSGTPLLLRLLIAVFPFLGSWTKML